MRRIFALLVLPQLLLGCAASTPGESIASLLEKSAQSQPRWTPYEKGKRELQLGNFGLAVEAFQAELRTKPDSIPALNGLAVAYARLGRADAAQQYFDRATALDPRSPITLNNLAYLNLTLGRTAVALDYGTKAQVAAEAATTIPVPNAIRETVVNNFALAGGGVSAAASTAVPTPALQAVENAAPARSIQPAPVMGATASAVPTTQEIVTVAQAKNISADNPPWSVSIPTRVRIANGVGRQQMASRFGSYFSAHGLNVRNVVNAASFDYRETVIFYNPDQKDHAEHLSRNMPFPVKLVVAAKGTGQIEIVLGADLTEFDNRLQSQNRVTKLTSL